LIAIIAAASAFIAPLVMLFAAALGLSEFSQTMELIKTWLAYIGPFAGAVIGYYFHRTDGHRND
jgi:uncharacterized membrane protein